MTRSPPLCPWQRRGSRYHAVGLTYPCAANAANIWENIDPEPWLIFINVLLTTGVTLLPFSYAFLVCVSVFTVAHEPGSTGWTELAVPSRDVLQSREGIVTRNDIFMISNILVIIISNNVTSVIYPGGIVIKQEEGIVSSGVQPDIWGVTTGGAEGPRSLKGPTRPYVGTLMDSR